MNSLLINAGIPQLRCVFAGGRFVYVEKVSVSTPAGNYQQPGAVVDELKVAEIFRQVNALAEVRV
ncbi:hypothetical protein IBT47_10555 [Erwinia sp. S43]|uniref:hypothetical protein n=1 Tax=Erwinia sp. S43 TaxID=2769339 RepID=UPI00190CEB34|nr:hypothetical protein [Erwinia sp. S43]MBK0032721.1 hypothetical protein [Erwinia sp. S43]